MTITDPVVDALNALAVAYGQLSVAIDLPIFALFHGVPAFVTVEVWDKRWSGFMLEWEVWQRGIPTGCEHFVRLSRREYVLSFCVPSRQARWAEYILLRQTYGYCQVYNSALSNHDAVTGMLRADLAGPIPPHRTLGEFIREKAQRAARGEHEPGGWALNGQQVNAIIGQAAQRQLRPPEARQLALDTVARQRAAIMQAGMMQ